MFTWWWDRYEKEEREVNLQKILNHKNVLKIRKVDEDDDLRYHWRRLYCVTKMEQD